MKKLLLVIDAQNDFVNDLTRVTLKKIEELVKSKQFTTVAFTKFINSNDNRFYKDINYKGCLTEDGVSIAIDTKDYKIFNKNAYTALTDEFRSYLKNENISQIYLCGFDTNACVLKTALDLFEGGYDFYVLKDYCMSSFSKEVHDDALTILNLLIGNKRVI